MGIFNLFFFTILKCPLLSKEEARLREKSRSKGELRLKEEVLLREKNLIREEVPLREKLHLEKEHQEKDLILPSMDRFLINNNLNMPMHNTQKNNAQWVKHP